MTDPSPPEREPLPDAGQLARVTALAHQHLGLDVVYVAELAGERLIYRAVAGDAASFGITLGDGPRAESTYCQRLLDGTLPGVISDARGDARVADLPATREADIGAYLGVPLTLADGTVYGTFCCLSHDPDPSLSERDLRFMALLADLIVEDVDRSRTQARRREAIQGLIDRDDVLTACQPIIDLNDGRCLGVETLARFPEPFTRPDLAFAGAHAVGLGFELERLAAYKAAQLLPRLDAQQFLTINVSPQVLRVLARRASVMPDLPLGRMVAEITEHAVVDSYNQLRNDLAPLRERGLRIAIDDAGAGYASLHHVVELKPDFIKVDLSLVDGVADDHARRVAVSAFVLLALDLNARVVAEGVEALADLSALCDLGVDAAQGYLLARPSTDLGDLRHWRWQSPEHAALIAGARG
jgi:EAL domain-containing protein (putative c-di-GMP-specific phosphodiesterase class I)